MSAPSDPTTDYGARLVRDAVVIPPHRNRLRGGILPAGVLDGEGHKVPEARLRTVRLSNEAYDPEPERRRPAATLTGRWLFAGALSHHFGHQITLSLGRLPWVEDAEVDGILYVPQRQRRTFHPIEPTLAALGLELPVHLAKEPTRVAELVVGPDLFGEATDCIPHPRFIDWTMRHRVAPADPEGARKLYVTRTGMGAGAGRLVCEDVMEDNLVSAGFTIFRPEDHAVADQLRAYVAADTIVTTDGSAGHLIALGMRPGQTVATIARRRPPPQHLVSQLDGFAEGAGAEHVLIDRLRAVHWPRRHADNIELGEIDFAATRDDFVRAGILAAEEGAAWHIPSKTEIDASRRMALDAGETLLDAEGRAEFLREKRATAAARKGPSAWSGILRARRYSGDDPGRDIRRNHRGDGDLVAIYETNDGPVVHKWHQYFAVYERYFSRWRGTPVRFLEIGVAKGGSLAMWRRYFGEEATLFGIDIDPGCARFDGRDGQVRIGSQDDPDFLARVVDEMGGVDVVLDDGSHVMAHIRASLGTLFPRLSTPGTYLIEDLHTAYWPDFGGGRDARANVFDLARGIVDDMHGWCHGQAPLHPPTAGSVTGLHVHDSILVLDKDKPGFAVHSRTGRGED